MILYHGSYIEITKPDLLHSRKNVDFGKGFYMAVSKNQAIGMMHKKYKEMIARRPNLEKDQFAEILYELTIDTDYLKTLNVKC